MMMLGARTVAVAATTATGGTSVANQALEPAEIPGQEPPFLDAAAAATAEQEQEHDPEREQPEQREQREEQQRQQTLVRKENRKHHEHPVLAEIGAFGELSSGVLLAGSGSKHSKSKHSKHSKSKSNSSGSAEGPPAVAPSCVTGTFRLVGPKGNKVLPDASITGSSYWMNRADHGKGEMWRTRLDNDQTTWMPADGGEKGSYVQWDFGTDMLVTKLITKGRHNCCDQWLSKYKVYYKGNVGGWVWVLGQDRKPVIFTGNSDKHTEVSRVFAPPLKARFVRMYVEAYVGKPAVRADFEGCNFVDPSSYKGPPGPKGLPGPAGEQGDQGEMGIKGAPGKEGALGEKSPKIDCVWAEWGEFEACSRSCGGGGQLRNRPFKVYPQGGGLTCQGASMESKGCSADACPTTTTTTKAMLVKKSGAARLGSPLLLAFVAAALGTASS